MMLTQYVAVRELGSTFFATELITLAAVIAVLVGPSLGYAIAPRLSRTTLGLWGALTLAANLGLPVGVRAAVGWLARPGMEATALTLLLSAGALLLCGFYATFLPQSIRNE